MLLTTIFICACHRNGPVPGMYKNEIEFNTYEELVNDINLEDEFLKNNPTKSFDTDFLVSYPIFDAFLPESTKTQYFKCGIDSTKSPIITNKEELAELKYDLRIMRLRWILIKNNLDDCVVYFSFYNWINPDNYHELRTYDLDSFEWQAIDTKKDADNLDKAYYCFEYINNIVSSHEDLYGGTTSYRIVDSYNNRIINMHILGKENTVSVFNKYSEYIMNKCLEMFL